MKTFEYADKEIGSKEIFFAVPSMLIGVGILTLPRQLAIATGYSDGVISILIGGLVALIFTWMIAKVSANFPGQSFYEYTSYLLSKPVAIALSFYMCLHFVLFTAYEVRAISFITKHYLLNTTPTQAIALVYLLVVIYAVSGDRVGLFRLNMMFLPIILFIILVVAMFTIPLFESINYYPLFKTSISGYLKGAKESFFSFSGYEILFFYVALMNRPKKAGKSAIGGIGIVIILYVIVQLTCIGVFGYAATSEIVFPTIELAKEVQVPGGFFERFESIFFTVWIMAFFNTTAMALDIAVFSLTAVFNKKARKRLVIIILAPVVYLIAMLARDLNDLTTMGKYISLSSLFVSIILPLVFLFLVMIRRRKQ